MVNLLCQQIIIYFSLRRAADKAIKFINADRALHMVANQARPPKQFGEGSGPRQFERNEAANEKPSFSQSQPPMSNRFSPRQPHQATRPSPVTANNEYQSWRSPRDAEPNRQQTPINRAFNTGPRDVPRQPKPVNGSQMHQPAPHIPNNTNVGQCNRCQRRAELKCQRCGDFYCSHACQKVDWPKHKRHCFPMPELVAADEPLTSAPATPVKVVATPKANGSHVEPPKKKEVMPSFNLPLNKPDPIVAQKPRALLDRMIVFCDDDPKSGDIVAITWVCSTNRVFIVQNEGKMGEEYREMLNWASRPENHGPPFEESPEKGSLVFAEFENDWYRAVVQKVIDSDHVLVAFFDFGNAEQLHFTKLRQYTGDDDPVRYTYNVYLKDCPYDQADPFPTNVAEYLKKFSDQFTPLRLRYSGEWNRTTNVELFVAETDVCINDRICALLGSSRAEFRRNREEAMMNLAKQAQEREMPRETKIYYDDLRCERMDTENKTRVIVLCCDGLESNSIWCCLETANTAIKAIDDAVNKFAGEEENFTAVVPE